MKRMRDLQTIIFLTVTVLIVLAVGATSYLSQNNNTKQRISAFAGIEDISLEPYCKDGYYKIPGEPACSRAPNCGGYSYDDVNTQSMMPNPQACTTNPNACDGSPPLCCYEMARTGDFTKCVGYWERLWCPKVLCDQARSRGASDSQCGGSCQCNHAFGHYCGDNVAIVPLSQRLGIAPPATSTPIPPTATKTPQPTTPPPTATQRPTATTIPQPPTATLRPNQPTPTTKPGTTNQPTVPPGQPTNTISPANPNTTSTPAPTWTITPNNPYDPQPTESSPFSLPFFGRKEPVNPSDPQQVSEPIEIKSPKELAREVVNPESVQKLDQATEKPLTKAKEGFDTVKKYDQKLESYFEGWIFRIRVWMSQILR